jgi:CubicO group peptidase (beta-lactamase class C family)
MSQDEGKLSLDDSPKKYLPYFKINDAEIDKNITVRDLMSHSSGLNRTDLGWITGKLTREEIIRVAGEAKPMAKLHEKFFYQNVMFVAAGEIVAKVQKQPWEKFVPERIFQAFGNDQQHDVAQRNAERRKIIRSATITISTRKKPEIFRCATLTKSRPPVR